MEKKNVIQIYKTFLADTITPVVVLQNIVANDYCFLLESVEGGEKWGRYSVLGFDPHLVVKHEEGAEYIELIINDTVEQIRTNGNTITVIRDIMNKYSLKSSNKFSRFAGGMVGYFGYPIVSEIENIKHAQKPIDFPDIYLMMPKYFIIFDNINHTYSIICNIFSKKSSKEELSDDVVADANLEIDKIHDNIISSLQKKEAISKMENNTKNNVTLESSMSEEEFISKVKKIKEYICEGDIIQTVFSERFKLSSEKPIDKIDIYRALRYINPSPYMFFLKFKDTKLIGASPEVMLRLDNKKLTISPIAGTRKRGDNEIEDRQLAEELQKDEKEKAEHVMLVDLARNDAGRVSETGSVQVTKLMSVEKYSHVMHLVSCVESYICDGLDCFDALAASFPAGTLSGAPKVRAMEIIQELEEYSRGPYGGAVGYISFDGNMDSCITIRTIFCKKDDIYAQAGAGIVFDSIPEKEYEEVHNKIKGILVAAKLAANGLSIE